MVLSAGMAIQDSVTWTDKCLHPAQFHVHVNKLHPLGHKTNPEI